MDDFASSSLCDFLLFLVLKDNYEKTAYATDLILYHMMHWTIVNLYTSVCEVNNALHFRLKFLKPFNTFWQLLI